MGISRTFIARSIVCMLALVICFAAYNTTSSRAQVTGSGDFCELSHRFSKVESHYAQEYFDWQLKVNEANVEWQRALLDASMKESRPSHVLEIGCSAGFTLKSLSTRVETLSCLEINRAAIKYGRRAHPDIDYSESWNLLPNNHFDFAFSFDSLEHHPAPLDSLACLRRKMKTGGRIFISVPFEHGGIGTAERHVYGRTWFSGDKHQHLYTWNPLNLGNLLTHAGFEVVECFNADEANAVNIEKSNHLSGAGKGGPIEKLQIWCIAIAN